MLVQALAAYADTYLAAELGDPAFESKPVGYVIEFTSDGRFARVGRRVAEQIRGKKTLVLGLPLEVPRSPINRNAGVYALPGCDAVQYLVGPGGTWTKDGDREKHDRQHQAFVERLEEVARATNLREWKAASSFARNDAQVALARNGLIAERVKTELVTLRCVDGEAGEATLIEEPSFKGWWRTRFHTDAADRVDAGSQAMCLISGQQGPVAETHDKIMRTKNLGGRPSGVALMSFDKKSFQSYGWEKNANSPVSPERARAYVLALNDLLIPGRHRRGSGDVPVSTRYDAGGSAFLFWTSKPTADDWVALLNEPDDQSIRSLLVSPHTGQEPQPSDDGDFFMTVVSGNGGRLVVRHWFRDTLRATRTRLHDWFDQMRIAAPLESGRVVGGFPLWRLLTATERDGVEASDAPSAHAIALLRRAMQGSPLGHALLAALLHRLRLSQGRARLASVRMGLLRLCLNDVITQTKAGELPMSDSLDESLKHPAYLCGRLLAVFDGLQFQAQGEVGSSIVDRYFALASTNPQVAFPKIEQLAQHHLKKLRRDRAGAAIAITRVLAELHEAIAANDARFPGQLSLEDQGRFAIGFHHQKAFDQARIAAAKAERSAQTQS